MTKYQRVESSDQPEPSHRDYSEDQQPHLPPIDRGWAAWSFVLGCYLVEGFCWGLVISFGVFQKHYSQEPVFKDGSSYLAVVGTWNASLACFLNPPITKLIQTYPRLNVPFVWLGWAVCVASLFLASFSNNVWHLVLTQGMMFGTGWALNYSPWVLMLNQWFVKKRGLVYGIICGASGLGAMVLPFFLEPLLQHYGFRTALRITAAALALVSGPPLLFIRPRVPMRASKNINIKDNQEGLAPFRSLAFFIFLAAYILQALGWFLPRFYLPSFTADLGFGPETSSGLLGLWGAAQVAGQLGLGWASDKVSVFLPTAAATGFPALAVFLFWAPAKTTASLAIFTVLYGGFGGGFAALIGRMAMYCAKDDDNAVMVTSLVQVGRGIGAVLSGPISSVLIGTEVDTAAYALGKYKHVAMFVGITGSIGALSGLGYFFTTEARPLDEVSHESSDVFLLQDQEPRSSTEGEEES